MSILNGYIDKFVGFMFLLLGVFLAYFVYVFCFMMYAAYLLGLLLFQYIKKLASSEFTFFPSTSPSDTPSLFVLLLLIICVVCLLFFSGAFGFLSCAVFLAILWYRTQARQWHEEGKVLQQLLGEYCPPHPNSEVLDELGPSAVLVNNVMASGGHGRRDQVETMVDKLLELLPPELVDMIYAHLRAYDIMNCYHKNKFDVYHLNRRLQSFIPAGELTNAPGSSYAEKLYQRNYIPMINFWNSFKNDGEHTLVNASCNDVFAWLLHTGLKELGLEKVQLDVVFDDSSREVLSVDLKRCGDTVQLYLKVTNNERQWEGREPVTLTADPEMVIVAVFYDKKANLLYYVKSERPRDTKLFLCHTSDEVQFSRQLVEINSATSAIHLSTYGDHVFLAVPDPNITLWCYYNLKTDQHYAYVSAAVVLRMVQVENTMLVHTLRDVRLLRVDDEFEIVWRKRRFSLVQLNDRTCLLYKTVSSDSKLHEAQVLHYKAAGWEAENVTESIGLGRIQRCSDHIFASVNHTSPEFYFHEVFNGKICINQIKF